MKIALVTPYLAPDLDRTNNKGMSWYSDNLVHDMLGGNEVTVICDQVEGVPDDYEAAGVRVRRRWARSPLFLWQALNAIRKERPDVVHIQHEVFLYGGVSAAATFPLLPLLTRLGGCPVVVTMHNGVLPRSQLSGEFLKENGIDGNPMVMKAGLTLLIKLITLVSNKVIVHEEAIKRTLVDDYGLPSDRVEVVHHGIEEKKAPLSSLDAKRKLGLDGKKVVLFLGYIAGYKNLDLLIDSIRFSKTEDLVVLIGGGEHPRLKDDPKYQRYVAGLKEKALTVSPDRIRFVGFVREEELPLYVSASDLMVFPYRAFMSASGPLTIAMAYDRPILVSQAFRPFVRGENEMFHDDPQELASKMDRMLADPGPPNERAAWYGRFFDRRKWAVVSTRTLEIYQEIARR